jgi:hypothetical protein
MSDQKEDKSTREERKKARNAAALLLNRLRDMCKVVDRVSEWRDIVAEVEGLLKTYQDDIPADRQRRLREAMELPEATLKGMQQACQVLQAEVEGLIKYLKPAPAVATILTAGVIVIAAGVFVLTVVSNALAVDILVQNQGCGDLPVAAVVRTYAGALLDTPLPDSLGISMPEEIQDGGSEVVSLPPVGVRVDNMTERSEVRIKFLWVELPLHLGEATDDVVFDGESLLGRQTALDLGPNDEHELTIRCEG